MLLHLSLCFLASVSYQWSEQIATASMPRAHRAKERPAYSSNLPAAIPQLHRNTMDIFTTGKALERETTQKPPEQLLGVTWQRLPPTSPTPVAHIHAAEGCWELQSSALEAVLESHRPLLLCGGDLARSDAAFHFERERASDPPIQRCPAPLARSTRAAGAEGIDPPEETWKLRLISPLISFNLASSEIQKRWLSDPQAHHSIVTGRKSSTARDLPLARSRLSRFREGVTRLFFVSASARASSSSGRSVGRSLGFKAGSKGREQEGGSNPLSLLLLLLLS